ncbi:hypothetical protein V5P93_003400 [Actinokineospora auranticolor]|uniref:Uncharacterized protein n=1 Tax=Actinokineospora auranticolor TaxID=155976 RepID=A0A2S6GPK7_9PSEU|nr:hypothetical protein [Actinokineospora auranticolor]PPK67061.1 hypothetical protein CLV40_10858 [Actinokineospora auranticolor]
MCTRLIGADNARSAVVNSANLRYTRANSSPARNAVRGTRSSKPIRYRLAPRSRHCRPGRSSAKSTWSPSTTRSLLRVRDGDRWYCRNGGLANTSRHASTRSTGSPSVSASIATAGSPSGGTATRSSAHARATPRSGSARTSMCRICRKS